ncbi:hypothetical protein MUK42_02306 [Musa troglodytarum]|uniref:Uncharacterized protein n=1 Tax=Musa troglodytarum TaxID=320322 RepID=A0A9E7FXZ1_9LILI|nr:hypothetical protein MUK42_02306 [Musa troglodytarum]
MSQRVEKLDPAPCTEGSLLKFPAAAGESGIQLLFSFSSHSMKLKTDRINIYRCAKRCNVMQRAADRIATVLPWRRDLGFVDVRVKGRWGLQIFDELRNGGDQQRSTCGWGLTTLIHNGPLSLSLSLSLRVAGGRRTEFPTISHIARGSTATGGSVPPRSSHPRVHITLASLSRPLSLSTELLGSRKMHIRARKNQMTQR